MLNMNNIMAAWPIPTFEPRPIQRTALEWIQEQYPNTKYFFIQAPVGSGKSLIGMTAAPYTWLTTKIRLWTGSVTPILCTLRF